MIGSTLWLIALLLPSAIVSIEGMVRLNDAQQLKSFSSFLYTLKIVDDLRETELKPPIVNQQSVVYEFKCDLCDTNYIGYTRRHLHQRVEEHKHSVIGGKHLKDEHNLRPSNLRENFTILKKCRSKLECLIFEMLYIRKKRPKLNTQTDSIHAKLFV